MKKGCVVLENEKVRKLRIASALRRNGDGVQAWSGFMLIDAEGEIVLWEGGSPRLYVTTDQARHSMKPGWRLLPVTLQGGEPSDKCALLEDASRPTGGGWLRHEGGARSSGSLPRRFDTDWDSSYAGRGGRNSEG